MPLTFVRKLSPFITIIHYLRKRKSFCLLTCLHTYIPPPILLSSKHRVGLIADITRATHWSPLCRRRCATDRPLVSTEPRRGGGRARGRVQQRPRGAAPGEDSRALRLQRPRLQPIAAMNRGSTQHPEHRTRHKHLMCPVTRQLGWVCHVIMLYLLPVSH